MGSSLDGYLSRDIEEILSIKEVEDGKRFLSYAGYDIETTRQVIRLRIYNEASCCESWGYFMSEDDLSRFIGAKLYDIKLVDTALNTQKLVDVYDGGIMFVNFETDRGTLQFVAFNEHNGYYGHDAFIESEQLNAKVIL